MIRQLLLEKVPSLVFLKIKSALPGGLMHDVAVHFQSARTGAMALQVRQDSRAASLHLQIE